MDRFSLRLRVFLFFGLLALGGSAIVMGALWLGYRQLGSAEALSAFVTAGAVSAFGVLALVTFVWRLFDEHLCKPIEAIAAGFRVHADAGISADMSGATARYLGDLAPAAERLHGKLQEITTSTADTVAQKTARLEGQRAQLLRILSDIPVAVIVVGPDHQICLYDGQAADLMAREAPVRLDGSVFDYLDAQTIHDTLARLARQGRDRKKVTIKGHSGAFYSGHMRVFETGGYTLMLEALSPEAARPIVYDFDLIDRSSAADPRQARLRDLCFTVFDSETTGLDPETDRVVQLGAVRIVNGRVIAAERFDTLVDPGIPIPPASTKVHQISDAMVQGAPTFPEARARFHDFASGSVIVAHNAPFDMAFLHRDPGPDAAPFDHPVLDTVHMSAVVFGGSAEHTLDAICDRLEIEIPAEHRHTALGDAIATAEAFAAMLPILEARGFDTFGALRAEMKKHSRILRLQD